MAWGRTFDEGINSPLLYHYDYQFHYAPDAFGKDLFTFAQTTAKDAPATDFLQRYDDDYALDRLDTGGSITMIDAEQVENWIAGNRSTYGLEFEKPSYTIFYFDTWTNEYMPRDSYYYYEFANALFAGAAALTLKAALAQGKLNVGYMKIGDLSPLFLAMEKAFFKDAGLEINLASMVGGAAIMPALASGSINIGWSNVISIYQGHLQGFDFRFVANGAINKRDTNDVFGVCVTPDSPITSARDLAGKTVAVNTLRNIMHAATAHWIDANGGESARVKWVEIPFPQMALALANKQVDAYGAVEPFVTVPMLNKQARLLGRQLGALAPRLIIASYFGSEAWIAKNVAPVKGFVVALNRGIDAHNANPEEAKAVLAKHTGLKAELFRDMPLPAFEKAIVESDFQPMLDVALRYKFVERKFPVSEVISRHVQA